MAADTSDFDFGQTLRGFAGGQVVLKRYTLVRMLGRGGMGVVWLARDNELEREIALKFLPEVVATDKVAIDDMKREVRRSIDLAHPHIVKIHDFVTDGVVAGIAMEYVDGRTLAELRLEQPGKVFAAATLQPWIEQLASALDYAHRDAQVVHRDLKPVNLMITKAGRLKVLDFGIAASISESASRVSNRGTSGTITYMSPQQLLGKSPTPADDWYAVGATLYELLSGKPPFFRGEVTTQILHAVPEPLAVRRAELGFDPNLPAVPAAWEAAVLALLAKEPAARLADAAALRAALQGAPAPVPVRPEVRSGAVPPPLPAMPLPPPPLPVSANGPLGPRAAASVAVSPASSAAGAAQASAASSAAAPVVPVMNSDSAPSSGETSSGVSVPAALASRWIDRLCASGLVGCCVMAVAVLVNFADRDDFWDRIFSPWRMEEAVIPVVAVSTVGLLLSPFAGWRTVLRWWWVLSLVLVVPVVFGVIAAFNNNEPVAVGIGFLVALGIGAAFALLLSCSLGVQWLTRKSRVLKWALRVVAAATWVWLAVRIWIASQNSF